MKDIETNDLSIDLGYTAMGLGREESLSAFLSQLFLLGKRDAFLHHFVPNGDH